MTIIETVKLKNDFYVSYWKRQAKSNDTIVFIHGYGSSKEHFRYAFSSHSLEDFTLVAIDLIGFGQSRGPDEFGYSMTDQASIVLEFLDLLGTKSFHLCAHSMGGLVAMSMAALQPERVLSLIDLEGNLTIEDCTFTGKVAGNTLDEFAHTGRSILEKEIRDAGTNDPAMREYADTLCIASTEALYKSACQTVEDSSTPLVEKFGQIKNVCYIYGEKNRGVFPAEKLLHASGIPVFFIENAGHTMAIENPDKLFRVMQTFIARVSSS